MIFDVNYDLRHKARVVAGGNWTVNDKEDIYSGVVCMDTVRIGFFRRCLYGNYKSWIFLRRSVWTFML
jgi:hypothetical protein